MDNQIPSFYSKEWWEKRKQEMTVATNNYSPDKLNAYLWLKGRYEGHKFDAIEWDAAIDMLVDYALAKCREAEDADKSRRDWIAGFNEGISLAKTQIKEYREALEKIAKGPYESDKNEWSGYVDGIVKEIQTKYEKK